MDINAEKEQTRHYKASDAFYEKLQKISVYEKRSIQAQTLMFLEDGVREWEKKHPIEYEENNLQIKNMTIKEIVHIIKASDTEELNISKNILIVEDSLIEGSLYKEILSSYGCTVYLTTTVSEALDKYKEVGAENIDFILIDYILEGDIKGDVFYKDILKIYDKAKAIILTSDMRKSIEQKFNNIDPPPVKLIRKSVSSIEVLINTLVQD